MSAKSSFPTSFGRIGGRILFASTDDFPRFRRYLFLTVGLSLLAGAWLAWLGEQTMLADALVWSGPDDPFLLKYRYWSAFLWKHDPHGIPLLLWGLFGILALGPLAPTICRQQKRPTNAWLSATVLLCGGYAMLAFGLLMPPLLRTLG